MLPSARGKLGPPHRQVLVPGLHRRIFAQGENLCRRAVLIPLPAPVIVDLVIVEGHDEGRRRVGGLQVLVALVLGVSPPVVVETVDLPAEMIAPRGDVAVSAEHRVGLGPTSPRLIDVVAVVEDGVQIGFSRQVGVGVVPAVRISLASRHGHARPLDVRTPGRRGPHRPRGTGVRPLDDEAVVVGPRRLQTRQFDVHAVAEFGTSQFLAAAHDAAEPLILRHFPSHGHRQHRHAAMLSEGLGRQPGPDHETVRRGVARRHAERKGIGAEPRRRPDARRRRQACEQHQTAGAEEKLPAFRSDEVIHGDLRMRKAGRRASMRPAGGTRIRSGRGSRRSPSGRCRCRSGCGVRGFRARLHRWRTRCPDGCSGRYWR